MFHFNIKIAVILTTCVFAFSTLQTNAQDLFRVDVTDGATTFSVSDNNFPTLFDDFLSGVNGFSSLGNGSTFTSRVRFLGVDDAIRVNGTITASTTDYTINIPRTGFSRSFNDITQEGAQRQVEAFFRDEGSSILGEFIKEMNSSSPLGILDGNPRSTTAIMANAAFAEYGLTKGFRRVGLTNPTFKPNTEPERTDENKRPKTPEEWLETGYPGDDGVGVKITFEAYYSRIRTRGYSDLEASGGRYGIELQLGDYFAVSLGLYGQVRFLGGTQVYDGGTQIAIPVTLIKPEDELPLFWQITPIYQFGGSLSFEAATAGAITGGGLNNVMEYYHGPFQFLMTNQFTYYEGVDFSANGYDVQTDLKQLIIKNAFKVTWNIFEFMNADASITVTHFAMGNAFTHTYFSPRMGINVFYENWVQVRLGYEGDIGSGVSSHQLVFKFDYLF